MNPKICMRGCGGGRSGGPAVTLFRLWRFVRDKLWERGTCRGKCERPWVEITGERNATTWLRLIKSIGATTAFWKSTAIWSNNDGWTVVSCCRIGRVSAGGRRWWKVNTVSSTGASLSVVGVCLLNEFTDSTFEYWFGRHSRWTAC